jgi:phenylpyruvate tautomerase PptA (4-oxalocrotonate tautomerase family)
MPMINVFVPENALTRAQVELLTEKLTHELLVIEGVDNDASRSIAWVMFHEVNVDQWAVGGRFDDHYVPGAGVSLSSSPSQTADYSRAARRTMSLKRSIEQSARCLSSPLRKASVGHLG